MVDYSTEPTDNFQDISQIRSFLRIFQNEYFTQHALAKTWRASLTETTGLPNHSDYRA